MFVSLERKTYFIFRPAGWYFFTSEIYHWQKKKNVDKVYRYLRISLVESSAALEKPVDTYYSAANILLVEGAFSLVQQARRPRWIFKREWDFLRSTFAFCARRKNSICARENSRRSIVLGKNSTNNSRYTRAR